MIKLCFLHSFAVFLSAGNAIMHPSLRLFSATQFRPVFKQGFFALKTSLVCNEKKPSFECKEALFLKVKKSKGEKVKGG